MILRCCECGTEAEGAGPEALCWCGSGTGFRCARNPARTPELPTEIIILTNEGA